MIALLRLFLSNGYLGLMMVLLVSTVVATVGAFGWIFKIDPAWFVIVGLVVAIPTAFLIAGMEAIAARVHGG